MQWDDSPNAGFSYTKPDEFCEPWIMVNPNYIYVNAEEQVQREDSVFKYYQKLIHLRKTLDIITYGNFELLLAEHSDLFAYIRSSQQKKLLVVCNFTNEERPLPCLMVSPAKTL
jgi:oligo-1,6-glucosidase